MKFIWRKKIINELEIYFQILVFFQVSDFYDWIIIRWTIANMLDYSFPLTQLFFSKHWRPPSRSINFSEIDVEIYSLAVRTSQFYHKNINGFDQRCIHDESPFHPILEKFNRMKEVE